MELKPIRDLKLTKQNMGFTRPNWPGWNIIVVLTVVTLVVASLALIGTNLSKTSSMNACKLDSINTENPNIEMFSDLSADTDPLKVFKYFFWTPAEFERFKELRERTRISIDTTALSNCTLTCAVLHTTQTTPRTTVPGLSKKSAFMNDDSLSRKRRVAKQMKGKHYMYHGCCESKSEDSSPIRAKNLSGVWKDIVQTKDFKQFFVQDTCRHSNGCSICSCSQPTPFIYQAIVYAGNPGGFNARNMVINFIELPGCCKCFNHS